MISVKVIRKDTTSISPEAMMSSLREMMNLENERGVLERDIDRSINEPDYRGAVRSQLEKSRENIICRFNHTREYIDSEIMKATGIKPKKRKLVAKNERVKKNLDTPELFTLTTSEWDFLKVLVTGESNIIGSSRGLRVADLMDKLIIVNHPVTLDGDPRKGTLAMLKDLETRGYAFRTGPSLHRVRFGLIKQIQEISDKNEEN